MKLSNSFRIIQATFFLFLLFTFNVFPIESSFYPALGDIDNKLQGISTAAGLEIVMTTHSGALIAFRSDRTLLNTSFPYYFNGQYVSSSPCLVDYDNDGEKDIAVFTEIESGTGCQINIINKNTTNLYSLSIPGFKSLSKPVIADIIPNATYPGMELLFSADDGKIYLYNLNSKSQVKAFDVAGTQQKLVTTGKLKNETDELQIVSVATNGDININSVSGDLLFSHSLNTKVSAYPIIGDFNNDGKNESAFITENGLLYTVNISSTSNEIQLSTGKYISLTFGDFDGDRKGDLIAITDKGKVTIVSYDANGNLSIKNDTLKIPEYLSNKVWTGSILQDSESFNLFSSQNYGGLHSFSKGNPDYDYSVWGDFSHVSTLLVFDGTQEDDKYFSPNGDGIKDTVVLGFFRVYTGVIAAQFKIIDEVKIYNSDNIQVRKIIGRAEPGDSLGWTYIQWDGRKDDNTDSPEGIYTYIYKSRLVNGEERFSVSGKLVIDKTKPEVACQFSDIAFANSSITSKLKDNVEIQCNVTDNFSETTSAELQLIGFQNETLIKNFSSPLPLTIKESNNYLGNISFTWKGEKDGTGLAPSGLYKYKLIIKDRAGNKKVVSPPIDKDPQTKDNLVIFNDAGINLDDKDIFASPFLFNPAGTVRNKTQLNFELKNLILEKIGTNLDAQLYEIDLKIDVIDKDDNVIKKIYDTSLSGKIDLRNSITNLSKGTRFYIDWDGKKDNSSLAPGGAYRFKVSIKDFFDKTIEKYVPVQIDNPKPIIESITKKLDGSYLISGTAVNRRGFMHYKMEYRKKTATNWQTLPVPKNNQTSNDPKYPKSNISYVHVDNGTLAIWDVFGLLSGDYEIRVTVTGSDGSYQATKEVTIASTFMVRHVQLIPDILSPDGDGIKDQMSLAYTIPDSANYQFQILDKNMNIMHSKSGANTSSSNYPASFKLTWDGKNTLGKPVASGFYLVKLQLSNGINTVEFNTNIQVFNTNNQPDMGTNVNVLITSQKTHTNTGSSKYALGIPYTWETETRGTRTPVHRVYTDILATGKQPVTRYPKMAAIITVGETYKKIRVDHVSCDINVKVTGWYGTEEYRTIIKTNREPVIIDRDTARDKGSDLPQKRFEFNESAKDVYDNPGADSFAYIRVENRVIKSTNNAGEWKDLSHWFNWNIGMTKITISTEKLDAIKERGAIVGGLVGTSIALAIRLTTVETLKKLGLKFLTSSFGSGLATAGIGSLAFLTYSFISAAAAKTDYVELKINIDLDQELKSENFREDGYFNNFDNAMFKHIILSKKDGLKTIRFNGLHDQFKGYEGILFNSVKTNDFVKGFLVYPLEYIPLSTRQTILHSGNEIYLNTSDTNENGNSPYWNFSISIPKDSQGNIIGDPVLKIRNNFEYKDMMPWPITSQEQFYSYVPDGKYDEILNMPQTGILSLTTNVSFGRDFVIDSLKNFSNLTFHIPDSISNIKLYSQIKRVEIIDSNGNIQSNRNSTIFPELINRIIPSINISNDNAVFGMYTLYQEDNEVLRPKIYGHDLVFIHTNLTLTNIPAQDGYHGDNNSPSWSAPFDVDYDDWDIVLKDIKGNKNSYLDVSQQLDSKTGSFTVSTKSSEQQFRKLFIIKGTTDIPNFQYYKLQYGKIANTNDKPDEWLPILVNPQSGGDKSIRQVTNGILGLFDVTDLSEGYYAILLTVVGKDGVGSPIIKQVFGDPILYNDPIVITDVNFLPTKVSNQNILIDPDKDVLQIAFNLSEYSQLSGLSSGVYIRIKKDITDQEVKSFHLSGTYGKNLITWNGQDNSGTRVSDGLYYVEITAYDTGGGVPTVYLSTNYGVKFEIKNVPLVISSVIALPSVITPGGERNKTKINYILSEKVTEPNDVSIYIKQSNNTVIKVLNGSEVQGKNNVTWDGRDSNGNNAVSGKYHVTIDIPGVTNQTISNLITIESLSATNLIAAMDPIDEDGDGIVKGISGNYFTWQAKLAGKKSPNTTANIRVKGDGIKYKEIEFDYRIGVKIRKNIDDYKKSTDALSTYVNTTDEDSDYNKPDGTFNITHSQRLKMRVLFVGTDHNPSGLESGVSRGILTIFNANNTMVGRVYAAATDHRVYFSDHTFNSPILHTILHNGIFFNNNPLAPSHYAGDYNYTVRVTSLEPGNYFKVYLYKVNRQLPSYTDQIFYKTYYNNKLIYNGSNWRYKVNNKETNSLLFNVSNPNIPVIVNTDYNIEFENKTIYTYKNGSGVGQYDIQVVNDLLPENIRVSNEIDIPYGLIERTSSINNIDSKIEVNATTYDGTYMNANREVSYGRVSYANAKGIIPVHFMTRSSRDLLWQPSGVIVVTTVNAFSPVTNSMLSAFSNMDSIPAHVYVHYISASNTTGDPNITAYFPGEGSTTTKTNVNIIIVSSNIQPWSTDNLTNQRLSGTVILPFEQNSIPYRINFFEDNQENYNPEKEGPHSGSKKNEIRATNLNLILKKGNRVLAEVRNNKVIKNDSEVQLIDKDTRAEFNVDLNLKDYFQGKGINLNKWLEHISIKNNTELARQFIEIKGKAQSQPEGSPVTYTLEWGNGENPSVWQKFSSGGNKNGVLGHWDITGKYGTFAVLLTVKDVNTGEVKQSKQVVRLGTGVTGDDVTIVSSPYGTSTLAFPSGSLFDGDELYIRKDSNVSIDAVVYGKFNEKHLPEGSFIGQFYSQSDLNGVLSLERAFLGSDGIQTSGENSEDLKTSFSRNTSISNLTPGYSLNAKGLTNADHILINELYFKTDYDQYIELYNPTSNTIDLSQYILGDGEGEGKFPLGSIIKSNSFIVIVRNAERFKEKFPNKQIDFEWDPLQYSGDDDLQVPNLLNISDLKPVYNLELNSSALRSVALIPIAKPDLYDHIGSNQVVMGPVYDFKPDGLKFNPDKPPTMTYRGKLSELAGQDPANLGIYYINDQNKVEFLPSSKVTYLDTDSDGTNDIFIITALVEHFSQYVMLLDNEKLEKPKFDNIPLVYLKNGITVSGIGRPNTYIILRRTEQSASGITSFTVLGKKRTSENGHFQFDNVVLNEGGNTIEAYMKDDRGRESEIASLQNIKLDTTNPTIIHYANQQTSFSPNNDGNKDIGKLELVTSEACDIELIIYNTNGNELINKKFIGSEYVTEYKNNLTWNGKDQSNRIVAEGHYRYYLAVYDKAGNRANDVKISSGILTLDNTPPEITKATNNNPIFSPNGDNVKETTKIYFQLKDNFSKELLLSALVRNNNASTNTIKQLALNTNLSIGDNNLLWDGSDSFGNIVGDGKYVIEITVVDEAGNFSLITKENVTIDITPPVGLTNFHLAKDKLKSGEGLRALFGTSEELDLQVRIINNKSGEVSIIYSNHCTPSNYQVDWTKPLLDDGSYICSLLYTDNAGNSATKNLSFIKDGTRPIIELPDQTNVIQTGLLRFKGTIKDANLDGYQVFVKNDSSSTNWDHVYNGNMNIENETVFTYDSSISNGLFSFKIIAYDTIGNTNEHIISSVTITNPETKIFYFPIRQIISKSNVAIPYALLKDTIYNINIFDKQKTIIITNMHTKSFTNLGAYSIQWNGKNVDGSKISDGTYYAVFTAYNSNDLVIEQKDIEIIFDREKPSITIFSPTNNGKYSTNLTISSRVMDDNLSYYQLSISKDVPIKEWITLKRSTVNFLSNNMAVFNTIGLNGRYILNLTALDRSFNRSETNLYITIDTTPIGIEIEKPKILSLVGGVVDIAGSITGVDLKSYSVEIAESTNNTFKKVFTGTNTIMHGTIASFDSKQVADGTANIKITAFDSSDNKTEKMVVVEVDNTAPVISINSNDLVSSDNGFINISGTVLDKNLSHFTLYYRKKLSSEWKKIYQSTMGVNNTTFYVWDINGLSGDYEMNLVAVDKVNNVNQIIVPFSIQNLKPIALIDQPLAYANEKGDINIIGKAYSPLLQNIILEIKDQAQNIVIQTNLIENSNQQRLLYTISNSTQYKDAKYSIHLIVTDTLGRKVETIKEFYIDNTKPKIINATVNPDYFNPKYIYNNGVSISFDLVEDSRTSISVIDKSGTIVRVLEKDFFRSKGSYYILWDGKNNANTIVNNDEYIVQIETKDDSQNSDSTNVLVRIDSEVPQTTLFIQPSEVVVSDKKYVKTNSILTFVPTDAKSGVKNTSYKLNNSTTKKYNTPIILLEEGVFNICYYSIDKLGNQETLKQEIINVDGSAPLVKSGFINDIKVINNTYYVSSNTRVDLQIIGETRVFDSGLDKINFKVVPKSQPENSIAWQQYTSSFTLAGYSEGTYKLLARAFDKVGNIGKIVIYEIVLDNTYPLFTYLNVSPEKLPVLQGSTNTANLSYAVNENANVQACVFDFSTNKYALNWKLTALGYKKESPELVFNWTANIKGVKLKDETTILRTYRNSTPQDFGTLFGDVIFVFPVVPASLINISMKVNTISNIGFSYYTSGTRTLTAPKKLYHASVDVTSSATTYGIEVKTKKPQIDPYPFSDWNELPKSNNYESRIFTARKLLVIQYSNTDLPKIDLILKFDGVVVTNISAKSINLQYNLPVDKDTSVELIAGNVTTQSDRLGVRYRYHTYNDSGIFVKTLSGSSGLKTIISDPVVISQQSLDWVSKEYKFTILQQQKVKFQIKGRLSNIYNQHPYDTYYSQVRIYLDGTLIKGYSSMYNILTIDEEIESVALSAPSQHTLKIESKLLSSGDSIEAKVISINNTKVTSKNPVALALLDISDSYLMEQSFTTSNSNVSLFISNNVLYAKTDVVTNTQWEISTNGHVSGVLDNVYAGQKLILDTAISGINIPQDVVVTNRRLQFYLADGKPQPLITAVQTNSNTNSMPIYEVDVNAINIKTLGDWNDVITGTNSFIWNGKLDNGALANEGKYKFAIRGKNKLENVSPFVFKEFYVVKDVEAPVISFISATPNPFSPNADGFKDSIEISYSLIDNYSKTIERNYFINDVLGNSVYSNTNWVSTQSVTNMFTWNGYSNDGKYTFTIRARDEIGNTSSNQQIVFSIDLTAPITTHNYSLSNLWINSNVNLLFASSDPMNNQVNSGLSNTLIQISNVTYTNKFNFTLMQEGNNEVKYFSIDKVGNIEKQKTLTIKIDKTAPAILISGFTNETWYNNIVTPYVSVIDTTLQSQMILLNNSNFISGTKVSNEGSYTLDVMANDLAGNTSRLIKKFYIDTKPPQTSVNLSHNSWHSTNVTLSFTVQDPLSDGVASGINYYVAIVNGQTNTNQNQIVLSNEGQNIVHYYALDNAGNKETEKILHINIDKQAPVISFAGFENKAWYNKDVIPVITITDNNLKSSNIMLDGQSFTSGTAITTEGKHSISVTAIDMANNTKQSNAEFYIDTTPAQTSVNLAHDSWHSTNVTLSFTVQDPLSGGVASGIDNYITIVNGQTNTNQNQIVLSNEGQNIIQYYALDKAGNKETEKILHINIDRQVPVINFAGFENNAWYNISVIPLITIADNNLKSSNIMLDGQSFTSGTAITSEGKHIISVTAIDMANNTVQSNCEFYIDKTAPVSTVNLSNGTWYNTNIEAVFNFNDPVSGDIASGVAGYHIGLEGQITATYTNNQRISLAQDGDYIFAFYAYDNTGNTEKTNNMTVHIDTVAPVLGFIGFTNNGKYGVVGIKPALSIIEKNQKTNFMMIAKDGTAFTPLPNGTTINTEGLYNIKGIAIDMAGNSNSIEASFIIDTTAPSMPSNFTALLIEDNILLNWEIVTNTDLKGYNLYRNGSLINTNYITNLHYVISDVTNAVYSFQISTVDDVGNESTKSETVYVYATGYISFYEPKQDSYYNRKLKIKNYLKGRRNTDYLLKYTLLSNQKHIPQTWNQLIKKKRVWGTHVCKYWSTKRISDGRYLLLAEIKDAVGQTHQSSRVVYIDNTKPETHVIINNTVLSNVSKHSNILATNDVSLAFTGKDIITNGVASGVNYTKYHIHGRIHKGWKKWTTNSKSVLLQKEGIYKIWYYSVDKALKHGNREKTKHIKIILDKTAPQISINGVENNAYYNQPVYPKVRFTDVHLNTKKSYILLNGQLFQSGNKVTANGKHTLQAVAVDHVGNKAEMLITFTIDTSAPLVQITGVEDNAYYDQSVSPHVTISDSNLHTSSVLLNGQAFVSGTTLSNDGYYTLKASASDKAGNLTEKTLNFTIDQSLPVITISGVSNNSYYNSNVIPIISITEANIKTQSITLNNKNYTSGSLIKNEGTYSLFIIVEDMLGRKAEKSISFSIDKTMPQISISGVEEGKFYKQPVIPNITVQDENIKSYSITLNDQVYTNGSQIQLDGTYKLRVIAEDKAGNKSEKTINFTIDTKAPEIIVSGVTHSQHYNTDRMVSIHVSETNLDYLIVKLNGKKIKDNLKFIVGSEGSHKIDVEAKDKAGNLMMYSLSFTIDKTAPVISIRGVEDARKYQFAIPFIEISDEYLNNNTTVITLNDNPFISGSHLTNAGAYTLIVSASDYAGNISSKTVNFSIVDLTLEELLMFHASYDFSLNADFALGSKRNYNIFSSRTGSKSGYHLKGLFASPVLGLGALYKTKDNIDPEQGTITLWVKNNWKTANYFGHDTGRWIFNIYQGNGFNKKHRYMSLAVFKDQGTVFTIYTNEQAGIEYKFDSDLQEGHRWYKDKKWTHFALSYDSRLGMLNLYLNGESQGILYTNPWNSKKISKIKFGGRTIIDLIGSFQGVIDEVRIYKEPLNQKQILEVYQIYKDDNNVKPRIAD